MNTLKQIGILSALVLAGPTLGSAEEITLKEKTSSVGETAQKTESFLMKNKLQIRSGGKIVREGNQINSKDIITKVTILAMDGDNVTKVKAEFIKHDSKVGIGKPVVRKSPLTGKTLVVEKKGETLLITEDGKAVSDKVATGVEEEVGSILGTPSNKFLKMLPKRTIKVGEPILVDKAAASAFMAQEKDSPFKLKSFQLKLTGTKMVAAEKIAVFEVNAEYSGNQGAMVMGYKLKGAIEVGVEDSLPRLLDLKGPVSISAKDATREMKGTGTLHTKYSVVRGGVGKATSKPTKDGDK